MNKSIFITTSIPYVNSKPHIGHAQEFVIADCIARSYRARGQQVRFQTGTDENAFKNVVAAEAAGISPQELVDRNSEIFRRLVSDLHISADTFIRTSEPRHRKGVEEFWSRLNPNDLYSRSYKGLYCIGCEDFYLEKDLVNNQCPDHKTTPEWIDEENIFFRLSRYEDVLIQLIESDTIRIYPEPNKHEVLSFIRQGLHDISLTRASSRSGGWGIQVPGNSKQVIYVWIDALVNYLSGQGFGQGSLWKNIWNEHTHKIHVIGKNVWKFHAVYWPALLLSTGLPLPNEILVHGFLTNNGVKISKSLGNTVDPLETVEKYGPDAVRHLLLTHIPIFGDSDFSTERVGKVYVNDLAHRLGNLYSRLTTLCEKAEYSSFDFDLVVLSDLLQKTVSEFKIQDTSLEIWKKIDLINAEINQYRPWELIKKQNTAELHRLLKNWCERLYTIGIELRPYIPLGAENILNGLSRKESVNRVLFPLN